VDLVIVEFVDVGAFLVVMYFGDEIADIVAVDDVLKADLLKSLSPSEMNTISSSSFYPNSS
jgi:hypothetical protein